MWNKGQVSPGYDMGCGCGGSQVSPGYDMGCGYGGSQVSPAFDAVDYCSNQVSPAYDMGSYRPGYKGSAFVLIVVLFILLIIVGKCHF